MRGCDAAAEGKLLVAKRIIQGFWQYQLNEWNQERWAYLFDEGLIDSATADAWADEIWPQEDCEDDEDDCDAD